MEDNSRRTGEQPVVTNNLPKVEYGSQVQRPNVTPVTQYTNEVKNVVEVRKPTLDEMKSIFLIMLRDNDVIEEIRKRL